MLKRPQKSETSADKGAKVTDEKFASSYPTIVAYLTDTTWDDGTKREVSSLTLSMSEGAMQLAMNDKDLMRSLYTTADTLSKALAAMEAALAGDKGQWRSWKRGKKS